LRFLRWATAVGVAAGRWLRSGGLLRRVAPVVVASEPTSTMQSAPASETRVEIVLGNGRRVVVPVSVDPVALGLRDGRQGLSGIPCGGGHSGKKGAPACLDANHP
jgi:hypothetical protein